VLEFDGESGGLGEGESGVLCGLAYLVAISWALGSSGDALESYIRGRRRSCTVQDRTVNI
jgi:hypothetical protein